MDASNHYTSLIQTVTELKTSLEKATQKIKGLEEQNLSLSKNYQVVKDELIHTRQSYNESKEGYLTAVAEKFQSQKQHDEFIENLKAQLLQRTREFEEVRDKLVPHDIDQLRIKVQEELELQHKQELKVLELDVENQKEKFYALKREYDRSKAEYTTLIQNQQREIIALRMEKQNIEEHSRHDSLTNISVDHSFSQRDEKLRTQTTKSNELNHYNELLKQELATVRQEKDTLVLQQEHWKQKLDNQMHSFKLKFATLESDKVASSERALRLGQELEKAQSQVRNSKVTIEELQDQITQQTRLLQDKDKQYDTLKQDLKEQNESLQAQYLQTQQEGEEEKSLCMKQIAEREDQLRQLTRDCSELQMKQDLKEQELRRYHNQQVIEWKKKYTHMELEYSEQKTSVERSQEQYEVSSHQWSIEKENFTSELLRIKREKEVYMIKLRELENVLEQQRMKNVSFQQEFMKKFTMLEKQAREQQVYISSLEQAQEQHSIRLTSVEREKATLTDQLEEQRKEMEKKKSQFQSQIESFSPLFEERAEELKKQWKQAIAKEKKRGDSYKAKALDAHDKMKTLIQTVDST